jgi:hypothetical protein
MTAEGSTRLAARTARATCASVKVERLPIVVTIADQDTAISRRTDLDLDLVEFVGHGALLLLQRPRRQR